MTIVSSVELESALMFHLFECYCVISVRMKRVSGIGRKSIGVGCQ